MYLTTKTNTGLRQGGRSLTCSCGAHGVTVLFSGGDGKLRQIRPSIDTTKYMNFVLIKGEYPRRRHGDHDTDLLRTDPSYD